MRTRSTLPLWLIVAALSLGFAHAASAQRAVFLVRHAEKVDDSKDARLSDAGKARAARLAALLRDAGVTAVFATEYRRTQKTAKPLAKALGLTVASVPAEDTQGLVARLRKDHARDVVLVVGHSHTLPGLLGALGRPTRLAIARDEYDNLFVVVPNGEGEPTILRLRY